MSLKSKMWIYLEENSKQILTQVGCIYELEIKFESLQGFLNSKIV
jgi:hypothetical protein